MCVCVCRRSSEDEADGGTNEQQAYQHGRGVSSHPQDTNHSVCVHRDLAFTSPNFPNLTKHRPRRPASPPTPILIPNPIPIPRRDQSAVARK